MDFSCRVAGGGNGGAQGGFVKRLAREDNGFPFVWEEDTFSTENVRRIVSLMCASHMEHAMPEIFTVV